MTGLLVLVGVLLVSTVVGLLHRSRSGRMRAAPTAPAAAAAGGGHAADDHSDVRPDLRPVLAALGHEPGERATLVQFSSAFCAPCRATRRVLGDVAESVPGVRHVEVDAESHLDVVRRLDVRKTPTTLVLDAAGRETARAAGPPRPADVLAALAHAVR